MCIAVEMREVKVFMIFLGTVGFSPHRERAAAANCVSGCGLVASRAERERVRVWSDKVSDW
jgi:hypothetical protein